MKTRNTPISQVVAGMGLVLYCLALGPATVRGLAVAAVDTHADAELEAPDALSAADTDAPLGQAVAAAAQQDQAAAPPCDALACDSLDGRPRHDAFGLFASFGSGRHAGPDTQPAPPAEADPQDAAGLASPGSAAITAAQGQQRPVGSPADGTGATRPDSTITSPQGPGAKTLPFSRRVGQTPRTATPAATPSPLATPLGGLPPVALRTAPKTAGPIAIQHVASLTAPPVQDPGAAAPGTPGNRFEPPAAPPPGWAPAQPATLPVMATAGPGRYHAPSQREAVPFVTPARASIDTTRMPGAVSTDGMTPHDTGLVSWPGPMERLMAARDADDPGLQTTHRGDDGAPAPNFDPNPLAPGATGHAPGSLADTPHARRGPMSPGPYTGPPDGAPSHDRRAVLTPFGVPEPGSLALVALAAALATGLGAARRRPQGRTHAGAASG